MASGEPHDRLGPAERTELAQVLGMTADTALPPGRQEVLLRHFMDEIGPGADVAVRGHRRARRAALVLTPVAAACAVLAVLGAGLSPWHDEPQNAPATEPAAVRLLQQAALAADTGDDPAIRDSEFIYVKKAGYTTSLTETGKGGMRRERVDENTEEWTSVDGSRRTLRRSSSGEEWLAAPGSGSLDEPTYRLLEALPTEPEALLKRIYAVTELNHGEGTGSTTGPDQEAFVMIGDLLSDTPAPPGISAALYRAAARIPGVTAEPEAQDAAGRPGVAVAREHNGERIEWIFDRQSLRLLGTRTVLLADSAWGKKGAVVEANALVRTGVADEAGAPPRGTGRGSTAQDGAHT